jgi:PAS domain S-box-containing protein
VIRQQAGSLLARQAGLERLAESAETHVAVMRRYAERRLDQVADLPEYAGPFDWPPGGVDPGPAQGALFANPATLTPDQRREVTAISAIFSLAEATHATRPYLRWSYYFSDSRAFMALYPWAPAPDILGIEPDATLKAFFDYDLFTMGEPAKNPDRKAYWTPVYVDAGGAGLMVTHAAPVWTGGRFRGVVATDVLLSYISTFLDGFPPTIARVAVVDQQGNLIASPGGVALTADVPTRAETLFGALSLTSTDGDFVRRDADLVSVSPIPGTPWLLVTDLQLAQVRAAALAQVTPLLALLAAVLAGLTAAVVLFSRQFVMPAVALVDYGALPAATAITRDLPTLPEVWRPLAERVLTGSRAQATQTAQLRAMVDGVPLRVVYLDSQRILRDVNREFLAFAGVERSTVLGQPLARVLGDAVDTHVAAMAPAIQRGETSRFEGWQTYRDHGDRFVQMSILPFTPPGEAEAGFLTFTRDLTDLKVAETEAARSLANLGERESRYRSVVVSALDAIIVMDDEGLAVEFNPTAERVFG